jgi:hypothetical protein
VTSILSPGALSGRILVGAALTAATVLAGPALASAAPGDDSVQVPNHARGDNGTVKIHDPLTPEDNRRNVPKVCEFQVAAFGFDSAQDVSWEIVVQGGRPSDRELMLSDTIVLDDQGEGMTEVLELPDGHYRLNWTFEGENGDGKHKVFKVRCETEEPSGDPTDEPTDEPTEEPTDVPTEEPTGEPTGDPTVDPSEPGTEPSDGATDPAEPTDGATAPAESEAPTAPADESGTPGGLPVTGGALAGLVAAGAVAVAGGGAAVYYSRKRRGNGDDAAESTEG